MGLILSRIVITESTYSEQRRKYTKKKKNEESLRDP